MIKFILVAVVSSKTCCESNLEQIKLTQDLLQDVEKELEDKFRQQFNIINGRITAIETEIEGLELLADATDRELLRT